VPAIVRYPGALPDPKVSEQAATRFDWTATILAAAGVPPHPSYPLDGIDLVRRCRPQAAGRPPARGSPPRGGAPERRLGRVERDVLPEPAPSAG
jgi:arylsulfatase A-like enzyme